jgi:CheY-like chemotaxis protein
VSGSGDSSRRSGLPLDPVTLPPPVATMLKRIRALPDHSGERVPAAALTAYASREDAVQARSAGFQAHLAKPITPTEVVSTVAALVGRV